MYHRQTGRGGVDLNQLCTARPRLSFILLGSEVSKGTVTMKTSLAGTALATILLTSGVQAAVSTDDFLVRTTGDLVKLCSADTTDPLYAAAIHFCHGFGAGVFQTEQLHQAASRAAPLYCAPNPMPTRNESVAGFVAWARATSAVANEAPAAGVLHYLMQTYPCPTTRR